MKNYKPRVKWKAVSKKRIKKKMQSEVDKMKGKTEDTISLPGVKK